MNNKLYMTALATAAVGVVAIAQPAAASTHTDTIAVSATVTENCVISASALAFGDVNTLSGQAVDGSGTIDVTCTNETPWAVSADAGQAEGASFGERKLVNGSDQLSYALYTDEARTNVWGEGEGATIGDTGTGSSQEKTFYGRVAANQTSAPAGAYSDTVTVTVSY